MILMCLKNFSIDILYIFASFNNSCNALFGEFELLYLIFLTNVKILLCLVAQ